ncbi:MAG TPA: quinolinate synthase NadA, partial [Vicinamibacterales bacterium]|nr:quinolinate synthase NadA [Vicinamibacterales bacterium]
MLLPVLTEYEKDRIGERQPLPERYLGLSDAEMDARIAAAKAKLGRRLVILGHHYQRDEVIKFADYTGDSFKLAQHVSTRADAEFIVFCGVHFMSESADVLSGEHQQVILPDLAAGCSMADMADPDQLELCWNDLNEMLGSAKASPSGDASANGDGSARLQPSG